MLCHEERQFVRLGSSLEPGQPLHFNAIRIFPSPLHGNHRKTRAGLSHLYPFTLMIALLIAPMFAAAGYSAIYLLCGGGLGGAVLIFIVAKMLGK